MDAGVINLDAEMPVVKKTPACAMVDAQNGLGQVAGVKAMDLALDMAADMGVGAVGVKSSNHFGVAAYYVERATARRMVGMAMTNASATMLPFNSAARMLGTNPLAIAVPMPDEKPPMVLDMATSEVARGKLRRSAALGQEIPLGWAVDSQGRPTTDANEALKGSLCPMSGPKGSGLSLMIDLLCGVLTGSCLTGQVKNISDTSGPADTAHLLIAINPENFAGTEAFLGDMAAVAERLKGLPPVEGGRVTYPGEIEAEKAAKVKAEGIGLPPDMIETLNGLGKRFDAGTVTES